MKHFQRGQSTFTCVTCGHRTRQTGVQSMGSELCPACFELAGLENSVSDGHMTKVEGAAAALPYILEIEKKGGDASEWRATFAVVDVQAVQS